MLSALFAFFTAGMFALCGICGVLGLVCARISMLRYERKVEQTPIKIGTRHFYPNLVADGIAAMAATRLG